MPCASFVLLLLPPFAVVAIAYVGGRVAVNGRLAALLGRPNPTWTGRVLVGLATLATLVVAASATVRIATA